MLQTPLRFGANNPPLGFPNHPLSPCTTPTTTTQSKGIALPASVANAPPGLEHKHATLSMLPNTSPHNQDPLHARPVSTHISGHQHSPPSISTASGLSFNIVRAIRRSADPTPLVPSPPSALTLAAFCPGILALTVVAHPDPRRPFRLAVFVSSTRNPLVVISGATRGVSAWRPWHTSGVIPILRARFRPATLPVAGVPA